MPCTSWPRAPISELCESIIDCVNKTAPTVDEATPYKMIRTTNVRDGKINLDDVKYVIEDVYKTWTRRQVPRKGDVILTREAPLGEVGMLRTDETVFLGQRLVSYRTNPSRLDNRFLLYMFQGPDLQGQIKTLGSGATVEHMRVPDAEKLLVPCPSLYVQQRIAGILSAYDDLIENNTKRIKILEEMARSLYREWFVHFRFPGHEKVKLVDSPLGRVPEGWSVDRLDTAILLQRGFDLPAAQRRAGTVPIYAATGVTGVHDEAKVRGPGVVTGRSGSLGTVLFIEDDYWPLNTTLWVKEFKRFGPYFTFYLLSNLKLQGLDGGAAVPTLNRNNVHVLRVIIPPRPLVDRFESVVVAFFRQTSALLRMTASLRAHRDLLLPRLISGEIDVSSLPPPPTA